MTRARPLLWILLAAALFMRAFVPQGYMPERSSEGGTIAVGLCASGGVHLIPLADEDPAPKGERSPADQPCAFAALASAALLPASTVAVPTVASVVAPFEPGAPAEPAYAPRLRPPVRGPPLPA